MQHVLYETHRGGGIVCSAWTHTHTHTHTVLLCSLLLNHTVPSISELSDVTFIFHRESEGGRETNESSNEEKKKGDGYRDKERERLIDSHTETQRQRDVTSIRWPSC